MVIQKPKWIKKLAYIGTVFLLAPIFLSGWILTAGWLPLSGGIMTGPIYIDLGTSCASLGISRSLSPQTGYFITSGGVSGICSVSSNVLDVVYFSGSQGVYTSVNSVGLGKISTGAIGNGFSRLFLSSGTSLVVGDFGSIAGACGSTASISSVNGTDSRGTFAFTSSGVGQASNTCTFTLTFHDGTFTNQPFVFAGVAGTLPAVPVAIDVLSISATAVQFEIIGLPVAASVYTFWFNTIG